MHIFADDKVCISINRKVPFSDGYNWTLGCNFFLQIIETVEKVALFDEKCVDSRG